MSVLLCLTIICTDTGTDVHARYYEDNDKYIEQRVADRMKKMSWEEKIAQMILVKAPAKNAVNIQKQCLICFFIMLRAEKIVSCLNCSDSTLTLTSGKAPYSCHRQRIRNDHTFKSHCISNVFVYLR